MEKEIFAGESFIDIYSPNSFSGLILVFDFQVLEEIRIGLELNDYGMQQRRIAYMRFLGELYNYKHADSSVIFETLYLILIYGHGTPEVLIIYWLLFLGEEGIKLLQSDFLSDQNVCSI